MWLITVFSVILMNTTAATDSDNRFTTGTFAFQQAAERQDKCPRIPPQVLSNERQTPEALRNEKYLPCMAREVE
ncbi:hypothetical protein [Erwinia sp. E_sp_B01_9]|uniref:hypothetical protein n=1 Tax=Erwinia sp. E_sp_B01_9 TaxID=3039403 RepID=UPI003D9BA907